MHAFHRPRAMRVTSTRANLSGHENGVSLEHDLEISRLVAVWLKLCEHDVSPEPVERVDPHTVVARRPRRTYVSYSGKKCPRSRHMVLVPAIPESSSRLVGNRIT